MRSHAKDASAPSTRRENATFSLGVFAAMLVCATAFLGIGASAASAAPEAKPSFGFLTSFGDGLTYPDAGRAGIAVDSHGNIIAASENLNKIVIFAPDATEGGTPLTEFSTNPVSPFELALDLSDDTLYVQDTGFYTGNPVITRYVSDGNPTPTYTLTPGFEIPTSGPEVITGIAVDPTTHDLLVSDASSEAIRRYDSSGTLLDTIATPSMTPQVLAAADDGSIYFTQASSSAIAHISGSGTVLGEIAEVGEANGLALNPTTGTVVAAVGNLLKSYSAATGELESEAPAPNGEEASLKGIAIDPSSGRLYSHMSSFVNAYLPAVEPGVEVPTASNVTVDGAHLSAEVDPGDGPPAESEAFFEYRAAGGDWEATAAQQLTQGQPTVVEADLSGLQANFEYQVRTVAKNPLASSTSGTASFSTSATAPVVETGSAVVGGTVATLNGTVNPVGLQTTYYFEYGTDTSYGSRVPVAVDAVAGNTYSDRAVSKAIVGLIPGTTYHYRLVATNSVGTTAGADRTFSTPAAGELLQRAYEQVTPVDKEGAQVNSDFHIQSAADGSAIAVSTASSPPGGTTANIRQNFLSVRGATDWLDWKQIDAPQQAPEGHGLLIEGTTLAVSEDFRHALVASNSVLAPGAIANGGNLYIKDLTDGGYTFIGGAPGPRAYGELAGGQQSETVYVAGAPDFSWIVVCVSQPMLPDVQHKALYRWDRENGLTLASVMDDGTPPTSAVQASQVAASQRAVSDDGKVVYFGLASGGAVYRRENGQTTVVSHSDGTTVIPPSIALPALLDGVSRDGRYAYFHTAFALPLTSDPVDSAGGALYQYDAQTDQVRFAASVTNTGQNALISDDGQTVYVDRGENVKPALRGPTVMWRDGVQRTIDPAGMDQPAISPSGRYLAWVRRSDHTARLYDADTDQTVCVSCSPDGSPTGDVRLRSDARSIGNQAQRVVNDEGMVFFDTSARLTSTDHNGARDVYMYLNGSLTLISPGNADFDARFVDASANGSSVFFQTDQGLVGQDVDGETDVYVARVGGGFPSQSPATPPAPCVRSECGPSGASPAEPTVGSLVGGSGGGSIAKPRISGLGRLTASDRGKLANGGKVLLSLTVNQPGTVSIVGGSVVAASIKAKKAGKVSVPIELSRAAQTKLRENGTLKVRFTIRFGGETQKVVSLPLKSAGSRKGDRS